MAGELMAGSKTPLKSIAVNQFGVSRFLERLFDHGSDGLCFLGSCFSLNLSAGLRIPVPGCAALGPAQAGLCLWEFLIWGDRSRRSSITLVRGQRWSPARAHFEGSVCRTETPRCPVGLSELLRNL